MRRANKVWWLTVLVLLSLTLRSAQAVVFSDNTFDLADYTISKVQNSTATLTASQILSGGNPGAAARGQFDVPISNLFS